MFTSPIARAWVQFLGALVPTGATSIQAGGIDRKWSITATARIRNKITIPAPVLSLE